MQIEFIGLPASGKSTVAKALFDSLTALQTPAEYPLYELYRRSWFWRNVCKTGSVAWYFLSEKKARAFTRQLKSIGSLGFQERWKLTFNNLYLMSVLSKYQTSKQLCIFDEGSLHHLWAMGARLGEAFDWTALLAYYPRPDVLIYVDASDESMGIRFKQRSDMRPGYASSEHGKILARAAKERACMLAMLDRVEAFYNQQVIVIRVTNDDDTNLKDLASTLRKAICA